MAELSVKFRALDLQQLARDGHDSVLVPLEASQPRAYTLQRSPDGYRWDPVAIGSVGARVSILSFRAVAEDLIQPFLFGEACRAFFSLPVPAAEITILFDTSADEGAVCRMGVLVISRR